MNLNFSIRNYLWNEYILGESILVLETDITSVQEKEKEEQRKILIQNYKNDYQKLMNDEYRDHQDATRKLWPYVKNYVHGDKPKRSLLQMLKELVGGEKKPIPGAQVLNFRDIYAGIQQWRADDERHMLTVRSSAPLYTNPEGVPGGPGMVVSAAAFYQEAMNKYKIDIEKLIDKYDIKMKQLAQKYQDEWESYLDKTNSPHEKLTDLPYFLKALGENFYNDDLEVTSYLTEEEIRKAPKRRSNFHTAIFTSIKKGAKYRHISKGRSKGILIKLEILPSDKTEIHSMGFNKAMWTEQKAKEYAENYAKKHKLPILDFRPATPDVVATTESVYVDMGLDSLCVPCSPGNYILAEDKGDTVEFYHGVALNTEINKNILSYYPQILAFGKQGK